MDLHAHSNCAVTHALGDAHSHTDREAGRRGAVLQCRWSGLDQTAEATPLLLLKHNIYKQSSYTLRCKQT